jgi:hypothetical protein
VWLSWAFQGICIYLLRPSFLMSVTQKVQSVLPSIWVPGRTSVVIEATCELFRTILYSDVGCVPERRPVVVACVLKSQMNGPCNSNIAEIEQHTGSMCCSDTIYQTCTIWGKCQVIHDARRTNIFSSKRHTIEFITTVSHGDGLKEQASPSALEYL